MERGDVWGRVEKGTKCRPTKWKTQDDKARRSYPGKQEQLIARVEESMIKTREGGVKQRIKALWSQGQESLYDC